MRSYLYFFQAVSIFLISATAVEISGARISDFSFLIFFCSIFLMGFKFHKKNIIFVLLIISIIFSTIISLLLHSRFFIDNSNSFVIPTVLVFSIFCLFNFSKQDVLKIINVYPGVSLTFCFILILYVYFFDGLPYWIVPDEGLNRFTGLSKNPNQLALSILPIPFFSIISYIEKLKDKKTVIFEIVAVVFLNVLVIGKGLFVSWLFSFVLFLSLGWQWRGKLKLTFSLVFTRIIYISIIAISGFLIFYLLYIGLFPGSQDDQGAIRLNLWLNGLQAWLDRPLIGHGPGHYSGLSAPYEGMESHNLFVDWLSAYGFFGTCILVMFLLQIILISFLRNDWIIFGFIVSLLAQSMFHFYGRQPIFWLWFSFAIILMLPSYRLVVLKKKDFCDE